MQTSQPIRLMLVDDHPVMRAGLANLLVLEKDFEVVAQSDDGESVVRLWQKHKPDVCLLDISMHGIDGIEAMRRLHHEERPSRGTRGGDHREVRGGRSHAGRRPGLRPRPLEGGAAAAAAAPAVITEKGWERSGE